jgi:hypothetical protein
MKTNKRRWKGELAKPIYVGSLPLEATSSEEASAWIEQVIEQEMFEKLPLLMQHYEIANEDDYFSLALALACDHVPGFQVVSAKLKLKHGNWGAVIRDTKPTEWSLERLLKLLNAVEEAKPRHGTDRETLKMLMQKQEWSRPLGRDEQKWLETLESRLQDAKRIKRGQGPSPRYRARGDAAILRELEEAARLAAATESATRVYASLSLELRFTALCLPFSIEQNSGI